MSDRTLCDQPWSNSTSTNQTLPAGQQSRLVGQRLPVTNRQLGVVCGFLSVVGYTLANVGLRSVAHCDPAWVSAMKAIPTLILMAAWLTWLRRRRVEIWPDRNGWVWLLAGALAGQFGGNWAFQWSLGVVGLTYAIPLSTGTMILGGAVLGRLFLHEGFTPRALLSMAVLITATAVLSMGAQQTVGQVQVAPIAVVPVSPAPWLAATLGVAAAFVSGVGYAVLGVAIRRTVTCQLPIATVMFVVSLTGVLCMGSVGVAMSGLSGTLYLSGSDYVKMMAAGGFTTAAFICLTIALRETSITFVNGLSAAQVAASSLLGYLVFHEPLSIALAAGVALTVVGLRLLPVQAKPVTRDQRA